METFWFVVLALVLALYTAMDGFDFGVGSLHLIVARSEEERRQVLRSVGPVWDGNEVLLIISGGLMFAAFPLLYATAFSGFYLPLMLVLWLLIFRALSIELRHQIGDQMWRQAWDVAFAVSGILLAIIFGAALGNVIRGVDIRPDGAFFAPLWTDPFVIGQHPGVLDWYTVLTALLGLATLAHHGGLWLVYKTDDRVRDRAVVASSVAWMLTLVLAAGVSVATFFVQPRMVERLWSSPVLWVFGGLAYSCLAGSRVLAMKHAHKWAFIASGGFIVLILFACAMGLYPYVLPATVPEYSLTIFNASAKGHGLETALYWFFPGVVLLCIYQTIIYRGVPKTFAIDDELAEVLPLAAQDGPMLYRDFGVQPALGEGPRRRGAPEHKHYHHPAAAWGAAKSVAHVLLREHQLIDGTRAIFRMNHENGGFDCPGCAWPDDRKGLKMDICENGIKHSSWEMTGKRCDAEFFRTHSLKELGSWSAYDLENTGRLTDPMVYDAATDHYAPISWEDAFELIGDALRGLGSPNEAAFYTSGRLSNEGTFLYQLFTREFGTNNQPDCSNMCHEASGRALTATIGTGKGTVDLCDMQKAEAIFIIGANVASNVPRFLTALADGVKEHGLKIVHINPLIEAAARKAITPHEITDMLLNRSTPTSSLNVQPRIGGDMALLRGVAKWVIEKAETDPSCIDRAFIDEFTSGFEAYEREVKAASWEELERQSAVSRAEMEQMALIYLSSKATVIAWCLGVTQQEHGVDTIREIVNVLLLKGNIGREGAGPCPIRGHSNVQGNRTLGINNHPTAAWLDKMDAACGITSPRERGLDTVKTIDAMHEGRVKVFFGLGGNFAQATPDPVYTEAALAKCELTVHVSTKLNRSHVVHGKKALILPTNGRTEKDVQASGVQSVTVEDSMSMVHLSTGMKEPASKNLRSEVAIVAGMAKATLPNTQTPWDEYTKDYSKIRDKISEAIVGFEDFNRRVKEPLGFRIAQPARERVFNTDTKKANFSVAPLPDVVPPEGRLMLTTMRSHDQWNTTIYSANDRYRGVKNLRTLIFMNAEDMKARNIEHMQLVNISSLARDGSTRSVEAYRAVTYDIPRGSAAGYMPELNVLCPIGDFSTQSDQPLMKQISIAVTPIAPDAPDAPDALDHERWPAIRVE